MPGPTKKTPNSPSMTIKTWEEEERKGTLGTVPQLLYANAEMAHINLKMQYKDPIERYKVINRAWQSLSKEEKKIYMNISKKNKIRKMVNSFCAPNDSVIKRLRDVIPVYTLLH